MIFATEGINCLDSLNPRVALLSSLCSVHQQVEYNLLSVYSLIESPILRIHLASHVSIGVPPSEALQIHLAAMPFSRRNRCFHLG